jgi:hypothetical protein
LGAWVFGYLGISILTMPVASQTLDRPQRWDAAFDPEMSDATVGRLLTIAPFSEMQQLAFPRHLRYFAFRFVTSAGR